MDNTWLDRSRWAVGIRWSKWKFVIAGTFVLLLSGIPDSTCVAVTSMVVRQSTGEQLQKGEAEEVIVSSKGTVELGRAAEVLVEKFEVGQDDDEVDTSVLEPWSINCIVVSAGTVYVGTSPNGGIYEFSRGRLERIYSAAMQKEQEQQAGEQQGPAEPAKEPKRVADSNEAAGEQVEAEEHLANEHVFAMGIDVTGRLLAGISGVKARLCRFEAGQMKTIFEPESAKYIFAIAVTEEGDIFVGTGPKGEVYRLNSLGAKPELVYDSTDKNILSLAVGTDGFVYAGSDTRGLVYKIDPKTKKATVLYDSEQEEITGLVFAGVGGDDLYAAATSARIAVLSQQFVARVPMAGRPAEPMGQKQSGGTGEGGRRLQIANTKKKPEGPVPPKLPLPVTPMLPAKASMVYRISKDGFVTDVFGEKAVFFSMATQQGNLLVGTGNDAKLFLIEPLAEEHAVIYEVKEASQITAVVADGEDIYVGSANPARLIKLGKGFAAEGTYSSDLIDAGQPARWGKLQIDADIPHGGKVLMASRSGNVKDVNDPTFSDWTEPIEVTGAVELRCPLGRFCQYKLILKSADGLSSPVIREVAVANVIPNLPPRVKEVTVSRTKASNKLGVFKINYKSRDENDDKLIYRIDFKKTGWANWIELEDELEKGSFEWDGRTVEDGRYEIKVTASDERSNTPETKLTGSRVSEPIVVDNTGPVIASYTVEKENGQVVVGLRVVDKFSVVAQLDYTVDSSGKWRGTLPEDLIYDTTEERFAIVIEDVEPGEHIISVRVKDDVGNTTYKTFEVN